MRVLTVLSAILLFSAMAMSQAGVARGCPGGCPYGWGPFIPLVTTPSVSLETVSPNPVGASNATGGLVAGATNSTLSIVPGYTDAVHTQAVWYSGGGSPLVAPAVILPRIGPRAEREHRDGAREQKYANWAYIAESGRADAVVSAASARSGKKATRTYTNQDIEQLKPPDNTVKYNGQTKKL